MLRRVAVGLVAAVLAAGQAAAGESQAAAAAESWSWTAAAGDGAQLLAAPRAEARPGRLRPGQPVDPLPHARLAWLPPLAVSALVPPPLFPGALTEAARLAPAALVAGGRSARGPPAPDAS